MMFVLLIQDEEEESNSSEPSQRKQFAIRMTSADQQLPVYNQDFVITELRPNSGYKLTLRVRNAFGFTNWTEEFHFETADGETNKRFRSVYCLYFTAAFNHKMERRPYCY